VKILQNGFCVDGCDGDHTPDTYDNICKKARYKYEKNCGAGTYNPLPQKGAPADCLNCPAGSYCPGIAFVGPVQPCGERYYCEAKATQETNDGPQTTPTKYCVAGYYCPTASGTKISCPAGKYCDTHHLNAPSGDCAAGYICTGGSTTPMPTGTGGNICRAGYYCPAGTTEEIPCPAGKYRNGQGAQSSADCIDCPAGKYCSQTGATTYEGECGAGFYCPAGTTTQNPASNYCPTGFYCPQGSSEPIPCEPTKFQLLTTQSSCDLCPAGYYCEDGTAKKPCPAGSYCPGSNALMNCPPGTYKTEEGGDNINACVDCPEGMACETPGLVYPVTTCAPGYYCSGKSNTRYPVGAAGQNGNKCVAGQYCPERSSVPLTCPEGEYCAGERLSTSTGKCQEGYYCPAGSTTGKANICPAGNFCPEGSAAATKCPIGTYGPLTGAKSIDDCLPCDYGRFCDTTGLSAPNAVQCNQGYYCPLSQFQNPPQTTICPKGYRCPTGSVAPEPCPPGYWQPLTKQWTCADCPEGYYCDGTDGSQKVECPRGYYCPLRTTTAYANPCPEGKYYDKVSGKASTDCLDCPVGFYCPNKGQATYADPCADGFTCPPGSKAPNPTGQDCPAGYYCPSGTVSKVDCPAGTFYDYTKAQVVTDCQNVLPGKYSELTGATTAKLNANLGTKYGDCSEGYVCYGGSFSASPVSLPYGKACSKGTYCVPGSAYEKLCDIGTYNDLTGKGSCKDCPAGRVCTDIGTITTSPCPSRYYCPTKSRIPTPCPAGRYSTETELSAESQCPACPGGSYCEKPATDTSTYKCAAGYVCAGGSADEKPAWVVYDGTTNLNGQCPVGSYCPLGSPGPKACAAGQYQDAPGNALCKPCPHGYGCTSVGTGILTNDKKCMEGYVCISGSTSLAPTDTIQGKPCPIGFYCPVGTPIEQRCADGTYQPLAAQGTCNPCTAGKICYYRRGEAAMTYQDCPPYYYCPAGSKYVGLLCPKGRTSNAGIVGLKAPNDCALCGKGKYCVDAEKDTTAADQCAAGYYCESGATSPTPANEQYAKPCRPGFYCDMGAQDEVQCPAGKFRGDPGARSIDECTVCLPGQYCARGNPVPFECPTGHYCPLGSSQPQKCPVGTYNSLQSQKQKYNCLSCPAGYFCKNTALSTYDGSSCPPSSYCLERATAAISCLAGFYITGAGRSADDCRPCAKNYYCPSGSSEQVRCPDGHECPELSPAPAKCEGGYYCYWYFSFPII